MTLATRLLLLIALALTPPLLFGILNDVSQRNERAAAIDQAAMAESRSVQDSLSLVVGGANRLLIAISEVPAIRSESYEVCSTYLKAVSKKMREYSLLAIIDLGGNTVCNDTDAARGNYSVADRAYFQRALATGRFTSGNLVEGIVTHRPSLHFAMPIRSSADTIDGVVIASIDQDWLAQQLAAETVPPGAQIILFDPSGTVVAAAQDGAPVKAAWIGRPAPKALLAALNVSTPRVVDITGPDGVLRRFGAVPADPALVGLTAVVGIDRERAFSDLRAVSLRNLLGLGLGGIVAVVAGAFGARRFVLGPLARIVTAADQVGAGDLNARTDLGRRSGELRELGAGFDRMIAALATREQERDHAESALRREEARLRLALEAGRLGSFEWNLGNDTVQPSEEMRTMYGLGPTEGFRSSDYFARIVPADVDRARAEIAAGIAAGRAVHAYRILRDGQQRHILIQAEVVFDDTGNSFLVGLVADETERMANIEALRDSEARFQAIANCIDQMVWSTRPDGYHDYFNQRWYEFTGTVPNCNDGPSWTGLFHPEDADETARIWQASLDTGQPYHREYRLRHISGRYRWVLARAQAIRDDHGRIVRWYGTCTDIDEIVEARDILARSREALTREIADRTAELMAAEDQLRQSQKMEAVGQLTGGIAHDFNNMLQAIGGALELLVRRVDQNKLEDAKRFATVARTTVDRAASLTHRLLAFARRQTLMPEIVDAAALVDGMVELVARTVGPSIDVSIRHRSDPAWTVLCDQSQLENVVFNLCINARDALPGGGKLIITTGNVTLGGGEVDRGEDVNAGDYVEIAVTDTGTGMDEATQARAFEPFFTTKPMGQGTGLGLSQVYGFVRQSGGFVRLESSPGHGTTVHLHLPRHDRAPPDRPPPPSEERSDQAVILLIDDDTEVREAAARNLRRLGYRVRMTAGGADAMSLLAGGLNRLDLLITTVGMPGNLNGRQIAEAARQAWPTLPVLFMTSYAGILNDAGLAPGMSIITKPISPEALALRIDTMLGTGTSPDRTVNN